MWVRYRWFKYFLKGSNRKLDDAGMQKIVDEANRQYQKWLKEGK